MSLHAARLSSPPLAGEGAGAPPRGGVLAPGGQGYLLWLCVRTLVLLALAILLLIGGGIVLVLALCGEPEPPSNSRLSPSQSQP